MIIAVYEENYHNNSDAVQYVYILLQMPDDKEGLCISADHCIRGGRNVYEFYCFYWQNVVT